MIVIHFTLVEEIKGQLVNLCNRNSSKIELK